MLETKYSGYIERQAAQIERFQRLESRPIPAHFDFLAVPQLRAEAKEKLARIRPTSLGQASRISGICPADLAVLLLYLGSSPAIAFCLAAGLRRASGSANCRERQIRRFRQVAQTKPLWGKYVGGKDLTSE